MEKSSKRGKIPQTDWPLIMARYEAGETLSSIARTYDCSPPAISYVVSRSRARQPGGEPPRPTPPGETHLIKAGAGNSADHAGNRDAAAVPPAQTAPPSHAPVAARAPEAPPAYTSPSASHPPGGDRGLRSPGHGQRQRIWPPAERRARSAPIEPVRAECSATGRALSAARIDAAGSGAAGSGAPGTGAPGTDKRRSAGSVAPLARQRTAG
jgi:hypothetical protein